MEWWGRGNTKSFIKKFESPTNLIIVENIDLDTIHESKIGEEKEVPLLV